MAAQPSARANAPLKIYTQFRNVGRTRDQLTPPNLFNSLLDKADENGIDARHVPDGARRNPIALAMISLGTIWLVSDSDARTSSLEPAGGFKLPGWGGELAAFLRQPDRGATDKAHDFPENIRPRR